METQHKFNENPQNENATPPRRAWFKPAISAALSIAATLAAWLLWGEHSGQASMATPAPLAQVTVSTPLVQPLSTRLGFLGQFSPVQSVELRAQVGGSLTGIFFTDGDIVQKGALLFTIDPRPYEIKLAEAQAQFDNAAAKLTLAESELRRAQALVQTNAGSVQNLEQRRADRQVAQAMMAGAKAAVDDARFDLDRCRIMAPFTGRIGTHLVSIGNLVAGSRAAASPTTLLATLVSLDPIYLDFDMSESDYQTYSQYRVQATDNSVSAVEVATGSEKDYGRKGRLEFINNVIDRTSGTIRARATVPNPDYRLTPGEFARLRLIADRPVSTLLLPDAAVLPDQSQHIVLTVGADGAVVPKQVEVGALRAGLRAITSGLNSHDRVIIGGIPYAAPGSKVSAKDAEIPFDKNDVKD